jgi:hypothetical protein
MSSSTVLPLPSPDALPARLADIATALRAVRVDATTLPALADPAARSALRRVLSEPRADGDETPRSAPAVPAPNPQAEAEQAEHDRYFEVTRVSGSADVSFVSGLVLAHAATYENAEAMGVTLLDDEEWARLFGGLDALIGLVAPGERALPPRPAPGWRDGYDPASRWLIGHQLFFALIQGTIAGLHCFVTARAEGDRDGADVGIDLAGAFMHSSAAAMKFTSDFDEKDYDETVRPAMSPPAVRAGFSGLQTRDHAYLVRLFTVLKPVLADGGPTLAVERFVESVVSAYEAHEFICARFRGDVLPSLRMAANSNGRSQRAGVEVIRDMMRARLALIDYRTPAVERVR